MEMTLKCLMSFFILSLTYSQNVHALYTNDKLFLASEVGKVKMILI